MFETVNMLMLIFWFFDVCNLPFMEVFDTVYPINGWIWFGIWVINEASYSAYRNRTFRIKIEKN